MAEGSGTQVCVPWSVIAEGSRLRRQGFSERLLETSDQLKVSRSGETPSLGGGV